MLSSEPKVKDTAQKHKQVLFTHSCSNTDINPLPPFPTPTRNTGTPYLGTLAHVAYIRVGSVDTTILMYVCIV